MYCKIWQKDFAKLPVATKELLFRDLQHFNGKSLNDAIASVPAGVDCLELQTMCEMWTTADERASHARTQDVPPANQSGSDSGTDEAADDYSDHDDHVS
ncbi:hypothetical protein Taro_033209 [Colocasia esculenta]|uniref:Uncharacterized protein n=1 Tax=Colocasia esculenta TaxID=4460 RepID=A0A843W436_COLES|nr:hypothetical protein [Colocasia esculenta]